MKFARIYFFSWQHRHFPKKSELHKFFNRSTVEVSCSTMPSTARINKKHSTEIANSDTGCDRPDVTNGPTRDSTDCNCGVKQSCPHNGRCLTESIVHRAEVRRETRESERANL